VLQLLGMNKQHYPDIDSSSDEDELVFSTLGTSIEEAFGDFEDDVDEVEFDSMDDVDE